MGKQSEHLESGAAPERLGEGIIGGGIHSA